MSSADAGSVGPQRVWTSGGRVTARLATAFGQRPVARCEPLSPLLPVAPLAPLEAHTRSRALPVGGPGGDWPVGGAFPPSRLWRGVCRVVPSRDGGSSPCSPAIPSRDVQPAASSAILRRVGVECFAGRPGAARVSARREGGSTSWRISRRPSIGRAEAGDAQVAAYCPRRRPGSGPDGCACCSPPSSSSPTSWSMWGSSA